MKLKLTSLTSVLFLLAVTIVSFSYSPSLYATIGDDASGLLGTQELSLQGGVNAARGDGQPVELFGVGGVISTITNTLLFIIGALSVLMIIIGGLRYVTSGGNASSVTAAKNTILYAIVGLVVAFLAYGAINFVLGTLTSGITGGTDV